MYIRYLFVNLSQKQSTNIVTKNRILEKILPKDDKSAFERHIYPDIEDWSVLIVTCSRSDYSASRIAHAVEDCDCHLLNLNVTAGCDGDSDRPLIELRVSATNVTSVARSLERYGFEVLDMRSSSASLVSTTDNSRIEHLLRLLDV